MSNFIAFVVEVPGTKAISPEYELERLRGRVALHGPTHLISPDMIQFSGGISASQIPHWWLESMSEANPEARIISWWRCGELGIHQRMIHQGGARIMALHDQADADAWQLGE